MTATGAEKINEAAEEDDKAGITTELPLEQQALSQEGPKAEHQMHTSKA